MALKCFTGFEAASYYEFTNAVTETGVTSQFSTTSPHSGAYCWDVETPGGYVAGLADMTAYNADGSPGAALNIATTWLSMYFKYSAKPTTGESEQFVSGKRTNGVFNFGLRLNSDGKVEVYRRPTTTWILVATSTTVLSANVWHLLQFKQTKGTGGAYELLIDGVADLSGTATWRNYNTDRITFGPDGYSDDPVRFFFDDIAISDSELYADQSVNSLLPVSVATNQWTGTYTDVDDIPSNEEDYISSALASRSEVYYLADGVDSGIDEYAVIEGIQALFLAQQVDASAAEFTCLMKSGATTSSSSVANLAADDFYAYTLLKEQNFDDSADWEMSDIAASTLRIGVAIAASPILSEQRCCTMHAHVLWTPGEAPPATDVQIGCHAGI